METNYIPSDLQLHARDGKEAVAPLVESNTRIREPPQFEVSASLIVSASQTHWHLISSFNAPAETLWPHKHDQNPTKTETLRYKHTTRTTTAMQCSAVQ